MQVSTIIFYNHWHNGDIHFSRMFIRHFMKEFPGPQYYYAHSNSSRLLFDIPSISVYDILKIDRAAMNYNYYLIDDTLFLNTWVSKKPYYGGFERFDIGSHLEMWSKSFLPLGIDIIRDKPKSLFVPELDFSGISNDSIRSLTSNLAYKRRVFFFNGPCFSNQFPNIDLNPVIIYIAQMQPDIQFYVTHYFPTELKNIIFTDSITNRVNINTKCDLPELSLLSTFCDVIVGKPSGPFAFACIKENFMNPDKVFFCIALRDCEFWYDEAYSRFFWCRVPDINYIASSLALVLEGL